MTRNRETPNAGSAAAAKSPSPQIRLWQLLAQVCKSGDTPSRGMALNSVYPLLSTYSIRFNITGPCS